MGLRSGSWSAALTPSDPAAPGVRGYAADTGAGQVPTKFPRNMFQELASGVRVNTDERVRVFIDLSQKIGHSARCGTEARVPLEALVSGKS